MEAVFPNWQRWFFLGHRTASPVLVVWLVCCCQTVLNLWVTWTISLLQCLGCRCLLFCQVLEVTNSRSARVQGCSQRRLLRFRAWWGDFYRLNFAAKLQPVFVWQTVSVCAESRKCEREYNVYLCKHARIVQVSKASAPSRPAIIANLQMYRTGRKRTINEYNMPALSNSLKSLKSIFLYCSKAVRICLNWELIKVDL